MLQRYRARVQVGLNREGDSSYSGPTPQSLGVCAAFFCDQARSNWHPLTSATQFHCPKLYIDNTCKCILLVSNTDRPRILFNSASFFCFLVQTLLLRMEFCHFCAWIAYLIPLFQFWPLHAQWLTGGFPWPRLPIWRRIQAWSVERWPQVKSTVISCHLSLSLSLPVFFRPLFALAYCKTTHDCSLRCQRWCSTLLSMMKFTCRSASHYFLHA